MEYIPSFIDYVDKFSISASNGVIEQWCRSVVKYGGQGQSGQAIKLFQLKPYAT